MTGGDIFSFYRQLLALLVGTYSLIRLIHFVWRWQAAMESGRRSEVLARRYLVIQILRLRISRFALDLVELGALLLLLAWVIHLHWK